MAVPLDRRLIAVQGVGGSPRVLALQGLWPPSDPLPEEEDGLDFLRQPPRRLRDKKKRRREEEALLVGVL